MDRSEHYRIIHRRRPRRVGRRCILASHSIDLQQGLCPWLLPAFAALPVCMLLKSCVRIVGAFEESAGGGICCICVALPRPPPP
jgi:hypothetical protein